ncbi:DJ-1 family glyoxalase III [Calditrichota bacterium]
MSKVLIPLAPGFEEIEAVTIIDLLRRAEIDVTVVGLEKSMVTGSHQISIKCDTYMKDVNINEYDVLILPGGQPGTNNLKDNETIISWIKKFSQNDQLLGAICAAPTVLNAAEILKGKNVTSYPSEKAIFQNSNYLENNVVKYGNVITSRGVGTAIEFALEVVNIIKGKIVRDDLAARILWKF